MDIRSNALGGKSVRLSQGDDLNSIPSPFRECLSAEHLLAFRNPSGYFSRLTDECSLDEMRPWLAGLASMAEQGNLTLEVCHVSMFPGHSQREVVFDFPHRCKLRLREPAFLLHLPMPLQKVYALIDGCWLGEVWAGSKFLASNEIYHDLTNIGGPSDAQAFFRNDTGDLLLFKNDLAFWFQHETSELVAAGSLIDVLSTFFRSEELPSPY